MLKKPAQPAPKTVIRSLPYKKTSRVRPQYDPWGLDLPIPATSDKLSGSPADRFTYNGKELQQGTGWLDYGARMYDPAGVRWNSIDLLAGKFVSTSSYAYVLNNPLKYKDLFGLDTIDAKNVDWPNFRPNQDVIALDQVSVRGNTQSNNGSYTSSDISQDIGAWAVCGRATKVYQENRFTPLRSPMASE